MHDELSFRLRRTIADVLAGGPCRALGPNAGVATEGVRVRYPDVCITCTPQDLRSRLVADPVVLIEVVSPGSEHLDRIVKLREYQHLTSVRQYVIIEQDSIGAVVFTKNRTGGSIASAADGDAPLVLSDVGISLSLTAVYQGLVPPA